LTAISLIMTLESRVGCMTAITTTTLMECTGRETQSRINT
jgi:hypothetical protein